MPTINDAAIPIVISTQNNNPTIQLCVNPVRLNINGVAQKYINSPDIITPIIGIKERIRSRS